MKRSPLMRIIREAQALVEMYHDHGLMDEREAVAQSIETLEAALFEVSTTDRALVLGREEIETALLGEEE